MLNFGPEKMIVIFFIALIVLGPEKMPEMARKMGKLMGELRKMSGGFQDEMRRVMDDTVGSSGLREIQQDLQNTVREATSIPSTSGPASPGVTAPDAPANPVVPAEPSADADGDR